MKKRFLVLSLFVLIFLSSNNLISQDLYFNVANDTGYQLYGLHISPSEDYTWSDDLLPEDYFDDGTSVDIYIPNDYGSTCYFDFKVTYYATDGNMYEQLFYSIDACENTYLTLNYDWTYSLDGYESYTDDYYYEGDLYFNITNGSDYLLYGIMISPYDEYDPYFSDWSEDLLTTETFDPGVSVDIYIPSDFYPDYCSFQFKVTYYAVDGSFQEKVLCWVDACEKGFVTFDNDWICTYLD